jgi:hypothetical protein
MGDGFYKLISFKSQHMKVTIQNKIISFSVWNSKWSMSMTALNSLLGKDVPAHNPILGEECIHTLSHVELGHVRAPFYIGLGMRPHPAPCWAVAQPSLTILGCSHKLDPIPSGLRVWVEPNVSQVKCATEGSLYTNLPISWVCVNNYDGHHNPIN